MFLFLINACTTKTTYNREVLSEKKEKLPNLKLLDLTKVHKVMPFKNEQFEGFDKNCSIKFDMEEIIDEESNYPYIFIINDEFKLNKYDSIFSKYSTSMNVRAPIYSSLVRKVRKSRDYYRAPSDDQVLGTLFVNGLLLGLPLLVDPKGSFEGVFGSEYSTDLGEELEIEYLDNTGEWFDKDVNPRELEELYNKQDSYKSTNDWIKISINLINENNEVIKILENTSSRNLSACPNLNLDLSILNILVKNNTKNISITVNNEEFNNLVPETKLLKSLKKNTENFKKWSQEKSLAFSINSKKQLNKAKEYLKSSNLKNVKNIGEILNFCNTYGDYKIRIKRFFNEIDECIEIYNSRYERIYEIEQAELNTPQNIKEIRTEIKSQEQITINKDSRIINLDSFKVECEELGFTKGTEKFGECVLKLSD